MRRKIIMRLIRMRLGFRNYEGFQFSGQKSKTDWYFFGATGVLWKITHDSKDDKEHEIMKESDVSLNYILSDACKHSIQKNGKTWPEQDV